MELKKQLKYPIKYTVMPVEEQIGWAHGLHELEREYGVVVNIVSKCYVIGERKEYLSDGSVKIKYEVVFPYTRKDTRYYDDFEPVIPEYNFYSQCTNSIFVSQLFNNFEEAQVIANQANKAIIGRVVLPYDKDFKKKLKEVEEKHQETLDRYKKIEETIEKETGDMEIAQTYSTTLEDIIEKAVEIPSEFYIKLAYALSVEEREYLMQLIENRGCSNCTNGSCRVEYSEQVGLDELGNLQGSSCLGWSNPELVGRQLILKKPNS